MIKRLIVVVVGAAAMAGCAVLSSESSRCLKKENPVKVGVYVGPGAQVK